MSGSDYNFQKLTPIDNVELSIYKEALDFVFKNKDLKNIGVSGAYSAGKSSVIETYKKLNPELSFIHISLAHFQPTQGNEKQVDNVSEGTEENVLEGKILNQLIHQIEPDRIPQTNFRVKQSFSKKKLWLLTASVSLLVVFLLYLFNWSNWTGFVYSLTPESCKYILYFTTTPMAAFSAGVFCIAIFTYLIYKLFKVQVNKNIFKGITVQGNTIEIFEQNDESYFDKYLNEVLYLFENSGKDVIVFEDMDRYNINEIFQRLREINTLVNASKKNKPLRFFYLLRDDIFVSKERTKFFDFIMPVVPVLDGSNSYDQFIAHFKEGNIDDLFNKYFLQELSLYIDDMRILKNIYNEFLIYYKRISTTEQDPNKLLAIIIYKNIFPRDFSKLQLNQGFAHTLFSRKNDLIEHEIIQLNEKITKIKSTMDASENEHLNSMDEVNYLFQPKIENIRNEYGTTPQQLQEMEAEKQKRIENIDNKSAERREKLKKEITETEALILALQHKKLHELIDKRNADEFFKTSNINCTSNKLEDEDIENSEYFPLIKYLIKNGYIDETYQDYMTYFYENSLSRVDKIFLRSVSDEDAKEYSYELVSPAMVSERLSAVAFNKEEALNFDLLEYVLNNQHENKDKMINMLQQIRDRKKLDFIDLYFEAGKPTSVFAKELNEEWPSAFRTILSESKFTETRKKQYALESLYHNSDDTLKKINEKNVLSNYVSTVDDFLDISNPNIQRIVSTFKLLNVKFTDINYTVSNKELFQTIYQHNFYSISYKLINMILEKVYFCNDEIALNEKNYTLVISKPNEPLVSYLEENIDAYVTVMLSYCDKICDSEDAVIRLLNNITLDTTLKKEYINKSTTGLNNLADIVEIELWGELLKHNLVIYSEGNVLEYYFKSGNMLDSLISGLINQKGTSYQFNYDAIDDEFEEGSAHQFFFSVLENENLNVEAYAQILKSLHRGCNVFKIENISDEKMDIIISQGVATMTPENLIFIREHYPQKTISFIKRNIDKYTDEVISSENFDFEELMELLDTDIADEYKIKLLQNTEEPISAVSNAYSEKVKIHILENNFDINDLSKLAEVYPSETVTVQDLIEDITKDNINIIIENENFVNLQLCKKIFEDDTFDVDKSLHLLAIVGKNLDLSQFKECLEILNQIKFLEAFEGKRPAVEINNTNEKLLDLMVAKHWIVSYGVDKNNESKYRISSRRKFNRKKLTDALL